jgi:hypothetical protein
MALSLGLAIQTYHDTSLPQPLFMQQRHPDQSTLKASCSIANGIFLHLGCARYAGHTIGELVLQGEIAAWSTDINNTQRGVDWHMKVEDARHKLISVYPKIKS